MLPAKRSARGALGNRLDPRPLRELGMRDALIEGKAALLGLLFGPRFFEDPFKSWAGLGAEAAVTAAWRLVIE